MTSPPKLSFSPARFWRSISDRDRVHKFRVVGELQSTRSTLGFRVRLSLCVPRSSSTSRLVAQPQLSTDQSCGPEGDASRRTSSDHSGLLPVEPYLASSIPFRRRLQPCPRRAMQKGDVEISAAATCALCPVLQSQIHFKSVNLIPT
ncbi:hypothetical protein PGT21_036308 [Puccinia graminis f. sp. tritici]|uniref:Uncharacterized protein n=1 Tax=Puccinia graminis f. sp. tritici TaxID=56615 RepID=A0A5B0Q099_PUCGR|nr:hypothetical protein PGT21_036308 [Puccinia graminis f. sp. tritici]KAA1126227.1 hypothetical protein PGTUg99_016691 [Puccinia graminis f. sp. tritici]